MCSHRLLWFPSQEWFICESFAAIVSLLSFYTVKVQRVKYGRSSSIISFHSAILRIHILRKRGCGLDCIASKSRSGNRCVDSVMETANLPEGFSSQRSRSVETLEATLESEGRALLRKWARMWSHELSCLGGPLISTTSWQNIKLWDIREVVH